jgi:hypothetical protein
MNDEGQKFWLNISESDIMPNAMKRHFGIKII